MSDQAVLFAPTPEIRSAETTLGYAEYRESSIPWLGRVPTHWTIEKLKFIASAQFSNVDKKSEEGEQPVRLCNYVDVYYHDRISADIAFMEATAAPREAVKFQLQPGDVLITKDSEDPNDICVPAVVAEPLPGVLCGYHLAQVRPDPKRTHGPYLMYAFTSSGIRDQFRMRANGITRFGLSQDDICSALFPVPTIHEQWAIAGWLDERTRRIDELVEAKRRLIDLLAEQRTALITHAVTKGLDSAATVPTGLTAFGAMPAHWRVRPLKYWSNLRAKSFIDGDWIEAPYVTDSGLRLIQCGNVGTGVFEEQGFRFVSEETFVELGCTAVRPGDVLICRMRSSPRILAGRACLAPNLGNRMVTAVDNCIVKCAADVDARFLVYLLTSKAHLEHIEAVARGGTRDRISRSMLGAVRLPCPPLEEQRRIADHLDAASARLNALAAATEAAIARLTEYRHALISAAVTGKINVCGATVAVPDVDASVIQEATTIAVRIGAPRRKANKYFHRDVLAAAIIARIGHDATFGWVKLQKSLILAEGHLRLCEIESEPVRAAAGPFDNMMMRSIHAQLARLEWYGYDKNGTPYKYTALAKAGGHQVYFDRYWSANAPRFEALMALLLKMKTRSAEVLATVYSAWNDFLIEGRAVTDDALVAEVMKNWHPAKQTIPEKNWRAAPPWMRKHGLIPTGHGAHTKAGVGEGGTP